MNIGVWFAILIASLAIEIITLNLLAGSVAVGALAGLVLSILNQPVWMQLAAFTVISALLIIVVRPGLSRYMNQSKKERKNSRLIGADAIVLCEIDNDRGFGVVNIAGREWSARSQKGEIISEGNVVTVVDMQGNTAIVKIKGRNFR